MATLLAIDIGNTNISFGVLDGARLRASWRVATNRRRMADEYRALLGELLRSEGLSFEAVDAAVIASVVPPVLKAITEALARAKVEALVLSNTLDFGMEVRYDPPGAVGADRLANAIAAQEKYGKPAIIVDLGTATTLDVLSADGVYIGGAIAPGIETSMEAMFSRAFQLPRLELETPGPAIGHTTTESIRSGTVFGAAGLVDGLIERFLGEMQGTPVVIATGGLAPLIAPHCKRVRFIDQDLTLQGLRLAYERVGSVNFSKRTNFDG